MKAPVFRRFKRFQAFQLKSKLSKPHHPTKTARQKMSGRGHEDREDAVYGGDDARNEETNTWEDRWCSELVR